MRKKVLYVDPISFGHHKHYNINNIKVLSEICDISVCVRADYLDLEVIPVENRFLIKSQGFPNNIKRKNKIQYFFRYVFGQMSILRKIKKIMKKHHYDLVIFSCVEIISFSIIMRKTKPRIVFIDHFLYMTQKYKWLSFFWKRINKKAIIGVLEEYFSEYIRTNLNQKNEICLLKHPISKFMKKTVTPVFNDKRVVFAPSNSNDMSFVENLILNRFLIPPDCLIYIKGDCEFSSDSLVVYSQPLERDLYDNLMLSSCFILIPYDETYNYRTSGVLFDAVSCNKTVLIKKGNSLCEYARNFPHIFLLFDSMNELQKLLSRKYDNNLTINECKSFVSKYDHDAIKRGFEEILKK